ncbi:MAG: glutathione S-transferase family protein [Burkholderiaceae bacterium]
MPSLPPPGRDTMVLYYTALSPYCRKVRMALDYKGLEYEVVQVDRLADLSVDSPRAEVPVLDDSGVVVCNSPDILAYIDRLRPDPLLYPRAAAPFADARRWEALADTRLDAVVSVAGVFRLLGIEEPPELAAAAAAEIAELYEGMNQQLATHEYLCGTLSAADFAAYPHVASGAALGLRCDEERHHHVLRWLKTLRGRPEVQADAHAVRDWWAHRSTRPVDVEKINWGAYRLEWLLASGLSQWFADQVRANKVLWSVGPHRQRNAGRASGTRTRSG